MSSTPSASNTNKTFSVTPSDNLSSETSYKIRVTTLVKDVVGNSMSNSYTTSNGFTSADITSPILSQVTAITTPTNDNTSSYTFSSTEAGTITYGGSCSSDNTSATTDNNTVTFNALADGTYDNCTITVTDSASNASSTLDVNTFVVDTTSPILSQVTAITTPDNDTTPNYTFSTNEAGSITYGGSCTSSTTSASSGNNSITFSTLSNGTYDNCTVMVTDNASNSSSSLSITTFIVNDISKESSASDNATVGFGQTYQYQFDTSGTYSGAVTYSLSNEPDNMTISSSGLVEWTPTKASEIKTHDNITITLTTASGFVLTETYDLAVTGTCTTGNVMSIWTGDQRTSTDSSNLLGNVTAYTDNSSSVKTASQNYNFHSSSVHLTHGPTPTATTGNVFFYNQYDNTTHLYFFYMFGVKGNSRADTIKIDIFTDNNSSTDAVVVEDDTSSEIGKQNSGCGSSAACYKGRHAYNSANSDGGVIGPFSGTSYRIFVDLGGTSTIDNLSTLTLGNLDSFKYYSKDGTSFALGAVDNFTVGFTTTIDCSN